MYPSHLFFSFVMVFSLYSALWTDHPIATWIYLEIALVALLPFLHSSVSITYFIIQSVGSMVFFVSTLVFNSEVGMWIGMGLKIGCVPCHWWVPLVYSNSSWSVILIMSTALKLVPFAILDIGETPKSYTSWTMGILCLMVGAWGGMHQTYLKPLLAFSSIAHLGWVLSIMNLVTSTWFIFFLIYSINMMILLMNFRWDLSSGLTLLSLGGMPPLMGFFPKLLVLKEAMHSYSLLAVFMFISSIMSLFYYLSLMLTPMKPARMGPLLSLMIFSIMTPLGLSEMSISSFFMVIPFFFGGRKSQRPVNPPMCEYPWVFLLASTQSFEYMILNPLKYASPTPLPLVLFMMSLLSFMLSLYFISSGSALMLFWNAGYLGGISWDIPFLLDSSSALFAAVVLFISSSILSFGVTYMRHEPSTNPRFWGIVVVFITSMLFVIFTPSILPLMIGWDGLGMSSFLLVIHYHNTSSLYGGYITIISNRIGDTMLLMVVAYMTSLGHNSLLHFTSYSIPESWEAMILNSEYFMISLLCLAAYSKSAQMPFNAWLPEAMAAPTPVSALVHSSTLVTAGIYVLIRSYEYWSQWDLICIGMWATGLGTMMAGGGKATTEGDVKKTIAYSTMSQLGFMVSILGLGFPNVAFFHLITHALFKATMFMSAGVIFAYNHHYQGFDNWRSRWTMPLAGLGLCMSLAALNIFPFLAGMYSKEAIVNVTYSIILFSSPVNIVMLAMSSSLLAASTFTMMYTVRLWRGLYFTKYTARPYAAAEKMTVRPVIYAKDNNLSLWAPFGCLLMGVVTVGSIVGWMTMLPCDMVVLPWWIKTAAAIAVSAGFLGAFIPCRGVTKLRGNQHVYSVRMKKKETTIIGRLGKSCGGYSPASRNNLLDSGLKGDWAHIHDGMHWFSDRTLVPFFRIYYLSGKAINLLEDGLLSLVSTKSTQEMSRRASKLSRSQQLSLEAMAGVGLSMVTFIIILLFKVGSVV